MDPVQAGDLILRHSHRTFAVAARAALIGGLGILFTGAISLRSAHAAPAVSAKDDLGTVIRLKSPARRIVAVAPNAVELLFAIGAGKSIVGAPAQADYPEAASRIPRIGDFMNPDEEAVLAKKPDLVVVAHGNNKAFIDRLKSRGLPVFVLHPQRVAMVPQAMRSLGTLTGHRSSAGGAAAKFQATLADLRKRTGDRDRPRTALLVWDDPITLAGAGAYLHDAIRCAGGKNIAGDLAKPYPTMDPEQFAVRNPAIIIFAGHDAARAEMVRERTGIRITAAARAGRVYHISDNLLLRPGPRLAEGIREIAKLLHPEAFQ